MNTKHKLAVLIRAIPGSYRWIHASSSSFAESIEITHLSHHHEQARAGSLHFCLIGDDTDGHHFAKEAVKNGARAIVCAYQVEGLLVPQIIVGNVRQAMAQVATEFFGVPCSSLDVVAITGTHGKTSTAHMLGNILGGLEQKTVVFGTLSGHRTTPEAITFQSRLAEAVAADVDVVVAEVTSHALKQHRVDGTRFKVAAFTNLGHEHLDYHGTVEDYFETKLELFSSERSELCVVDVSSEWGKRLASRIEADRLTVVDESSVDVARRSDRTVQLTWRGFEVQSPHRPGFLIADLILAAEIAVALGNQASEVARVLHSVDSVIGRFEILDFGQDFAVIVDRARTPEALDALLAGARDNFGAGPILMTFGCEGGSSAVKRRLMGQVSARHAQRVILTADNPRHESCHSINSAILSGVPIDDRSKYSEIPDRAAAIAELISSAESGQIVVIAGKGDDQFQIIADESIPFQDAEVARREIERRR